MNSTVAFTADQRIALEHGEPVRVTDAETKLECVVIRADVYERGRMLPPDLDPREMSLAVVEVLREDWDHPKMAEYDDYENRRP